MYPLQCRVTQGGRKKVFSFTDIQVKGKDYEMTLQCHEELITIPPPPILSIVALYQVA